MTAYESVDGLSVHVDGAVLGLTLDRAEKRNAMTDSMVQGMIRAITIAGNDPAVRAIVLSGEGDHFCAGFDIVARNVGTGSRPRVGSIQRRLPAQAHRLIPLMMSVQTPIVCVAKGWVAGIGLQMALAADFTVVSDDARLWEPFTERGFTPDSGATWILPRRIGEVRAREMLLLGRVASGKEAHDWGMVHQAVDRVALDEEADRLIQALASGATVALGLTKWLLASSPSVPLDAQLEHEALALELSSRSLDFREGLASFTDTRPPNFSGS